MARRRHIRGNPDGDDSSVRSPTRTSSEVKSPTSTRTRTEVRSPTSTSTSTRAKTHGNFTATVTGGAGAGANTTVHIHPNKGKRNPGGRDTGSEDGDVQAVSGERLANRRNRRNPEGGSESMYSSFHGTPSTTIDEYREEEHYHSNLAALGELVGLKVRTVSGYDVTLGFESGKATNPGRRSNMWPFSSFSRTTVIHVPSGHKFHTSTTHKGHTIYKSETKDGYVVPGIEQDSVFDSVKDAKKFIDTWTKARPNPGRGRGRGRSTGPFASSQRFVSDTLGTIYRPMNAAIGTVGEFLDRGLGKVGLRGNKRKANPDHVLLCSTEDGNNLQLVGGDQSLDLDALKIDGDLATKELVTVGEVWGLNYRTEKTFGDGGSEDGLTEYIHILGPKETKPHRGGDLWQDAVPPKDDVFGTGELPTLVFDKCNQKILLSGGIYHIDQPLMGTSAGIEH